MKILIVDDEKDIRDLIKLYLANESYEIIEVENGMEALEQIDTSVDLVLLDVMMPKLGGVETCMKIREKYTMPIIFLTAKMEDVDKLTGFSSGGDDYITKPFNPIDLMSRVKANIRRYKEYSKSTITENKDEISIHNIKVNLAAHLAYKNENPIKLTKTEFAILSLLLRNRGKVFSLEHIYANVWGEESVLNAESTVSVHIRNLRDKIEDDISRPQIIKTVWGVGYRVD